MRHALLPLALFCLVLSACSQSPAPAVLSAGCTNVNDAFYDDRYQSASVFFSPFEAGEQVRVEADGADTIYFEVLDSTNKTPLVQTSAEGGSSDIFTQDYEQLELFWVRQDGSVGRWQVECSEP